MNLSVGAAMSAAQCKFGGRRSVTYRDNSYAVVPVMT